MISVSILMLREKHTKKTIVFPAFLGFNYDNFGLHPLSSALCGGFFRRLLPGAALAYPADGKADGKTETQQKADKKHPVAQDAEQRISAAERDIFI